MSKKKHVRTEKKIIKPYFIVLKKVQKEYPIKPMKIIKDLKLHTSTGYEIINFLIDSHEIRHIDSKKDKRLVPFDYTPEEEIIERTIFQVLEEEYEWEGEGNSIGLIDWDTGETVIMSESFKRKVSLKSGIDLEKEENREIYLKVCKRLNDKVVPREETL